MDHIAHDLERFQSNFFIVSPQHQVKNLVKEKRIYQLAALFYPVARHLRHVLDDETAILSKWGGEKAGQLVKQRFFWSFYVIGQFLNI